MPWRTVAEWRVIRFVRASDDRSYTEEDWSPFPFRGRSVYDLRDELATTYVHFFDLIMCVRAGRYGRLTPLVVDLPHNPDGEGYGDTIEIVVITVGTPGDSLSPCLQLPTDLLLARKTFFGARNTCW